MVCVKCGPLRTSVVSQRPQSQISTDLVIKLKKKAVAIYLLTFQRISTDVVVCGVTERIVGASSGAEVVKKREKNVLN